MGGRGSSGGNNPGGSKVTAAASSTKVAVPTKITQKNLTNELYNQVYKDPNSIPVKTIIYDTDDTRFRYEGNGEWSFKNNMKPYWRPLQATVYDRTEVKERIRGALNRLNRNRPDNTVKNE